MYIIGARDLNQLDNKLEVFIQKETDPENIITFQTIATTTCKRTFKTRKPGAKPSSSNTVPWWTTQLTIKRKEVNAHRRRFQRTLGDDALRQHRKLQYHQAKIKY